MPKISPWKIPIFALTIVSVAKGNAILVAKTGGTHTTVQAGLDAAVPGDTVWIKAGRYHEKVTFGISGTLGGGFITLLGEPGSILEGTGVADSPLIEIKGRSFIRVQGLEIVNVKGGETPIGIGVSGGGSDIEIRSNHIHHVESSINAHGIALYGDAQTPLSRIRIDSNEIDSCKLGQSEALVLNGNVTDFEVTRNRVHDNDNIGIDFIGFEGTGPTGSDQARNGICRANRVYNISSAGNPTYGGERSADGIYVDGGKSILIEGNTVDNCDIGVEVASEHGGKSTSDIQVRNNFISRSYQGNIMAGGYAANRGKAENILLAQNTTYAGRGGEVVLQFNCQGVKIQNNLFQSTGSVQYLVSAGSNNLDITVDNNLYFGASSVSPGDWADAHALFANPGLVAVPGDLHLSPGSRAIDQGVILEAGVAGAVDIDGQARLQGERPDLGADEWQGSSALRPNQPIRSPISLPAYRLQPERDWLGRFRDWQRNLP